MVSQLFLAAISDIEGIAYVLPEILNGTTDVLEDISPTALVIGIARAHVLKLTLHLLGTLLAAVLDNGCFHQVILIRVLWIGFLQGFPCVGIGLEHAYDMLPVVGIDTTHGGCPQMGITGKGQFGINLPHV